jgi:hypothetical protein
VNSGPLDVAVLLGVPLGLGVIRVLVGDRREFFVGVGGGGGAVKPFWPQAAVVSLVAALFVAAALRPAWLVPLSPELAELVKNMRQGTQQLNTGDTKKLQRGYYEDLADAARFNPELSVVYGNRPKDWGEARQSRTRNDAIGVEFIPSTQGMFKGALQTINSYGLRDREYTLVPGPDTFRIALIGSSHDMGAGVKDNETYENVVEDRLNRELGPRTGKKYEILNFSNGGYDPTAKLAVIEQKVFALKPDLVIYVAYSVEFDWAFRSLPNLIKYHVLDQYPFMTKALQQAGVTLEAGKPPPEAILLESRLAPYAEDTVRAILERFRDDVTAQGARPAVVLMDTPDDSATRSKTFDRIVQLTQSVKLPIMDLQGAYAGVKDRKSLWIVPWDSHVNATGHQLLADRLYDHLIHQNMVPTEPAAPPAGSR